MPHTIPRHLRRVEKGCLAPHVNNPPPQTKCQQVRFSFSRSGTKNQEEPNYKMAAAPTPFITVADVDAVIVGQNRPTLYFTIRGSPPAQERARVRAMPGGRFRIYDPSARNKRALKRAIRAAMTDLGVSEFPFFQGEHPRLKIRATFGLSNMAKDVDNMFKFLLDGAESVLYNNARFVCDMHGIKRREPIPDQ